VVPIQEEDERKEQRDNVVACEWQMELMKSLCKKIWNFKFVWISKIRVSSLIAEFPNFLNS
jgi:hypothetical protein